MRSAAKIKWLVSILLAGIVLVLALLGGDWGTTYNAEASTNAPVITSITPMWEFVGTQSFFMVISGSDFGTSTQNVRVHIIGNGVDDLIEPYRVLDNGMSVTISASYMTAPNLYSITVIKSTKPSIPTLPIWPVIDQESNAATFTVVAPQRFYLPVVDKH